MTGLVGVGLMWLFAVQLLGMYPSHTVSVIEYG